MHRVQAVLVGATLAAVIACRPDRPLDPSDAAAGRRRFVPEGSNILLSGAGHYAAPNGQSNAPGTFESPWDLQTALSGGYPSNTVAAGDTIWLRGGVYNADNDGYLSTLMGSSGQPIYVRQYPGDPPAILDGTNTSKGQSPEQHVLTVESQYAVYWGFELRDQSTNRSSHRPHLIFNKRSHNRYVALVMHDGGVAFYNGATASDVEVIGSVSYNNGYDGPIRGHGHGVYVRNNNANLDAVRIKDNVFFNNYGYGVHAWTDAEAGDGLNRIVVAGNISFNNGSVSAHNASSNVIIAGNGIVPQADTARLNMTYFSPSVAFETPGIRIGWDGTTGQDVVVTDNYIVGGGSSTPRGALGINDWTTATVSGNTVYSASYVVSVADNTGFTWSSNNYYRPSGDAAWVYQPGQPPAQTFGNWKLSTGLGGTDQALPLPTDDSVFVRNASLDWLNGAPLKRGTIAVFNWSHTAHNAMVDLSDVVAVGDSFWIRNVQQLGTIKLEGIYNGGEVAIPVGEATVTPPTPIGGSTAPPNTHDGNVVWFDAFVVDSRTPSSPPPPPPSVTIHGFYANQNGALAPDQSVCSWRADVTGGSGTPSYQWYQNGTPVGTNSRFLDLTIGTTGFQLQVDVQSGGQSASSSKSIQISSKNGQFCF